MGGVATLVETAGALGAAFLQRPLNDAAALRHALDRRRRRPLPSPVAVVNPRVVPPVRVQPSAVAQGLRHGVRADALGEPRARQRGRPGGAVRRRRGAWRRGGALPRAPGPPPSARPVPRGAPVPLGGGRPLPAIIEIGCAYRLALAANHLDCGRLVDSWDL